MASKFSNSAAALALGMAFLAAPVLLGTTSPFAIDSAFAKKGDKGSGGSKSEKSSSAKAEKTEKTAKGSTASKLGALNAAHASTTALAHASSNSRVGKIAAYRDASAAAVESGEALLAAQDQLASLNEAVTNYNTALAEVTTAEENLAAGAPALQAIIDDPLVTEEAKATAAAELQGLNDAVDTAQTTADGLQAAADTAAAEIPAAEASVSQAEIDAAAAEALVDDALNDAANKHPVDEETKAALDLLLVGK